MRLGNFVVVTSLAAALVIGLASVGSGAGGDVAISGELRYNAIYQVGNGIPTPYQVSTLRYIVEAPPSSVGIVVPLDQGVVEELCRDKDGCDVSLQMVNWDVASAPGQAAHGASRLILAETTNWWALDDALASGLDDNGGLQEWSVFDCYFTDAEHSDGSSNQRSDVDPGFGLLNCLGCSYSDSTTTCRVVLTD